MDLDKIGNYLFGGFWGGIFALLLQILSVIGGIATLWKILWFILRRVPIFRRLHRIVRSLTGAVEIHNHIRNIPRRLNRRRRLLLDYPDEFEEDEDSSSDDDDNFGYEPNAPPPPTYNDVYGHDHDD